MKKLIINGNNKFNGTIRISGAKNSAVALIPAALLANGTTTICNVPDILDIEILEETLKELNVDVKRASETIVINTDNMIDIDIPERLSSKLRASYYFMSVLLVKFKHVKMHFPGGCQIGGRPIDQTLKAFKLMGANIESENDTFTITADKLVGTTVELDMPSVGATVNTILLSVLAEGTTVIKNAAMEPEIGDLINLLNKMGADISGIDTNEITINGVSSLSGCNHDIIPDRIEAGTYTIIGALLGNNLKIDNIISKHIKSLTDKLIEAGVKLDIHDDYLIVDSNNTRSAVDIKTGTYPQFPTDLQQPFVSFLSLCNGTSNVIETIYENRYMNVPYLNMMGADIKQVNNREIVINGVSKLNGCQVKATDLRAGASLLIAGLVANGETTITDINHLLRGYEKIIEKLTNIGAKIEIIEY